ncbi:hypothetical protein ACWEOH_15405 [Agromyces sp. NPDC004153]
MSRYRKLLAVGAGLGMLFAGAVAVPAAADPPSDPEVIRVQIYSVRYEGLWANARFSGACPADFPYLTDKKFSNDRILPLGVIIDTASSVATLVVATSSERRIEGRKEFVAVKSIEGSFTNWAIGSGTFTVTLECTSNWKKARIEGSDR